MNYFFLSFFPLCYLSSSLKGTTIVNAVKSKPEVMLTFTEPSIMVYGHWESPRGNDRTFMAIISALHSSY